MGKVGVLCSELVSAARSGREMQTSILYYCLWSHSLISEMQLDVGWMFLNMVLKLPQALNWLLVKLVMVITHLMIINGVYYHTVYNNISNIQN